MNPIFQAVMSRVVSELNNRCPVCDGRLETVSSGKHQRRRCVTCGADVPRRVSGHATSSRRIHGDAHARRPFRSPSQRLRRARS
jgi:tRNA(Ile2) C34 agmatinyltransferase TiaS